MAANDKHYAEVAQQLTGYMNKVKGVCSTLKTAGKDCVDNTKGDEAAKKSSANLNSAVAKIEAQVSTIKGIVDALNAQMETMKNTVAKVD